MPRIPNDSGNSNTNPTNRMATYKGRTYRLLFLGTTKFGQKAKLAFMDGSKEFWVDASLISEVPPGEYPNAGQRAVCAECGKGGSLVADMEDGLMKHPACCDMPPGGY